MHGRDIAEHLSQLGLTLNLSRKNVESSVGRQVPEGPSIPDINSVTSIACRTGRLLSAQGLEKAEVWVGESSARPSEAVEPVVAKPVAIQQSIKLVNREGTIGVHVESMARAGNTLT